MKVTSRGGKSMRKENNKNNMRSGKPRSQGAHTMSERTIASKSTKRAHGHQAFKWFTSSFWGQSSSSIVTGGYNFSRRIILEFIVTR
ncbi:hypothetical protein Leryth_013288 [Lithospermum erythrorhizon]|nr:hypothetical protein Leryth_013288 [Lithospermum erythrorhizon]